MRKRKTKINKIIRFLLIFTLLAGWIFSGWPAVRQRPAIFPERSEVLAAGTVSFPAANNACDIIFQDFDFNNHNALLYNMDQPEHPIAVNNNLDGANNLCATIIYTDSNNQTTYTIGEFSLCTPQCFGNDGTPLASLPPGRYGFIEYGNNFDACMGDFPGPGVNYQTCKDSSDFISESFFEITVL